MSFAHTVPPDEDRVGGTATQTLSLRSAQSGRVLLRTHSAWKSSVARLYPEAVRTPALLGRSRSGRDWCAKR